ncbi:MAG: spore protease YyaC [Veillonellales bacterium]
MLNNLLSFPKSLPELKFNIDRPHTLYDIAFHVRTLSQEAAAAGQDIIVLCIGTDRSTGDALGPLTGSKLQTLNVDFKVYGTLDQPVHATNLSHALEEIRSSPVQPFILAVDACLGKLENIGCVSLGRGPVKPGAAVNKNLPPVGNAYITGIVNVGGFMEHLVLQSTRLSLVIKMADTIAHGLCFGLRS